VDCFGALAMTTLVRPEIILRYADFSIPPSTK
jgi:hypothetical protein